MDSLSAGKECTAQIRRTVTFTARKTRLGRARDALRLQTEGIATSLIPRRGEHERKAYRLHRFDKAPSEKLYWTINFPAIGGCRRQAYVKVPRSDGRTVTDTV